MPTSQQPADVRDAASALSAALADHLRAVEASTGESDQGVAQAFAALREAAVTYDELLYDVHDEVLPFEVVEHLDDDDLDDLDDLDDDLDDDAPGTAADL